MKKMSRANTEAAFAGESQAHMRYLIFAARAEREGFPEVARLFRATAYAEQVHATSHLRVLGGIGKTAENLQEGINGETYEVEEMYPAFRAVAELQGERSATRAHEWALEAEKVHAGLYEQAKDAVEEFFPPEFVDPREPFLPCAILFLLDLLVRRQIRRRLRRPVGEVRLEAGTGAATGEKGGGRQEHHEDGHSSFHDALFHDRTIPTVRSTIRRSVAADLVRMYSKSDSIHSLNASEQRWVACQRQTIPGVTERRLRCSGVYRSTSSGR